jgi:hypothetical protein
MSAMAGGCVMLLDQLLYVIGSASLEEMLYKKGQQMLISERAGRRRLKPQ